MWKTPAASRVRRWAVFVAALALAWAVSPAGVRAGTDEGMPVSFGANQILPLSLSLRKPPAGRTLYRSAASGRFARAWDTALIEGTEGDSHLVFEFSKRLDDGSWSPWASAEIHLYQNGRFWGRVQLPMGSGALRMRVMDGGIAGHAALFISDIEVYDASGRAQCASSQAPNPPDPLLPPIIHTRREWHARPTRNPYQPQTPWRITIHHTAGPQTMTLQDSLREVRFIQDFQQNGRGWDDIGYHFLIDGAGDIIEGRPVNVVGSHVKGNNDGNVGIAMMGYFNSPVNDHLTDAQLQALVGLIRYLMARYRIPVANVKGHRDYEMTDCPGDNVYALLPKIREMASAPAPEEKPLIIERPPVLSAPRSIRWDGVGAGAL